MNRLFFGIWFGMAGALFFSSSVFAESLGSVPGVSKEAETMADLESKVETQALEIDELKKTVKALTERLQSPAPTAKQRAVKGGVSQKTSRQSESVPVAVEKLKPTTEFDTALSPDAALAAHLGLEGETVADSTQETMNLYYAGLEAMEQKRYDETIRQMEKFVKLNPRHVYADRAQYLLAEAAFEAKEYPMSIVATNILEAKFPYSVRLGEGLILQGRALTALNMPDKAKVSFEKVMKEFPNAGVSETAARELAMLKKNSGTATRTGSAVQAPPLMPSTSEEIDE